MSEDYKQYVGVDNRKIKVKTRPCIMCGDTGIVEVYRADYIAWNNGKLIQNVMPYLTRSQSEQMINGTHQNCSMELYGQLDCEHNFVEDTNTNTDVRCCEKCELWEDDQLKKDKDETI